VTTTRHFGSYEKLARALLSRADVEIGGPRPHDVQVHDTRFFRRAILESNLGLGESYMDGWWDCAALDELVARVLTAGLQRETGSHPALRLVREWVAPGLREWLGSDTRSAERHYEAGNALYEIMLDRRMTYSCAHFSGGARTLEEAQEAKLELCCRKLGLRPGQRMLDIGCGWGSLATYAAEHYGVSVVGITISQEQLDLARERCRGLPIEIRLLDYRHVDGMFDRIVSLGMFEHVGYRHYREYMSVAHRSLADEGLFLLETIGGNTSVRTSDAWFAKYIWNSPSSMYPSVQQVGRSVEDLFVVEDWHNFGADYDRTLGAWADNVESHEDWIVNRYGRRFYRMWRYYLRSCQGGFRARTYQMWQIVLAKHGVPGGYRSAR
jgi:cyclopropane-fatty-acyl-phospholipid synthase